MKSTESLRRIATSKEPFSTFASTAKESLWCSPWGATSRGFTANTNKNLRFFRSSFWCVLPESDSVPFPRRFRGGIFPGPPPMIPHIITLSSPVPGGCATEPRFWGLRNSSLVSLRGFASRFCKPFRSRGRTHGGSERIGGGGGVLPRRKTDAGTGRAGKAQRARDGASEVTVWSREKTGAVRPLPSELSPSSRPSLGSFSKLFPCFLSLFASSRRSFSFLFSYSFVLLLFLRLWRTPSGVSRILRPPFSSAFSAPKYFRKSGRVKFLKEYFDFPVSFQEICVLPSSLFSI